MKYKALVSLILFTILSTPGLHAQRQTVYFSENFSDSTHPWAMADSSYASTYIKDGEYYLDAKDERGVFSTIPGVDLKKNSNFKLSFTAHWRSGVENHGYGVSWGRNFKMYSSSFLVSNNGWMDVWTGEKELKKAVPSTFCSFLNNSQSNHFRIECQHRKVKIWVNDHIVYSGMLRQWAGTIYFLIYDHQTVSFDNIDLEYQQ